MSYAEINKEHLKKICQENIDWWISHREDLRKGHYVYIMQEANKPNFFQKLFKLKHTTIDLEEAKRRYWASAKEPSGDMWDIHEEFWISRKGEKSEAISRRLMALADVSATDTVQVSSTDYAYIK
jgi:hypothetical protein